MYFFSEGRVASEPGAWNTLPASEVRSPTHRTKKQVGYRGVGLAQCPYSWSFSFQKPFVLGVEIGWVGCDWWLRVIPPSLRIDYCYLFVWEKQALSVCFVCGDRYVGKWGILIQSQWKETQHTHLSNWRNFLFFSSWKHVFNEWDESQAIDLDINLGWI